MVSLAQKRAVQKYLLSDKGKQRDKEAKKRYYLNICIIYIFIIFFYKNISRSFQKNKNPGVAARGKF